MNIGSGEYRRALVWGARGFIGTHLVASLIARGWHVRVLSRGDGGTPSRPWTRHVEWVEFDPSEPARAFDRAVSGASVIFNLAGSSGAVASNLEPLESLDSNGRLQLEFLEACARRRELPHVIFASSRLVYAQAGLAPVTEEHPLDPRSMYAAHKLCIEHYHRIYALRGAITYTICRISNPYGLDALAPAKGYGFINALIQRALAGKPLVLFGTGLQLRDYLHVDDLTAMLRLCAERREAVNAVLNVALGQSVTMRDAAESIREALGSGPIEYRPWPREYELVESGDFVADTTRLQAALGYVPAFSFEKGLAAVCAQLVRLPGRPQSIAAQAPPVSDEAATFGADTVVTRG